MTQTSIIAQEVKEVLKLLKGVKRVTKELLQDVKELESGVSPYKPGQEVTVFWAGRERNGVVVDGLVNYNNAIQFRPDYCEPACVIRFTGEESKYFRNADDVAYLGIHCVVPHREIIKVVKDI